MTSPRTSDLASFPRPSVAVDVAVMTLTESGSLGVLVHRRVGDRAGSWALPGRFLRERERLAHAVGRTLAEKCGLNSRVIAGRSPRQLHVFDDPDRDDRGWVLSIAHLLALPDEVLSRVVAERDDLAVARVEQGRLRLPDRQRSLPYGQGEIVQRAVDELRLRYRERPDPDDLLGSDTCTLSELQVVHAAIDDIPRSRTDTFRRTMLEHLTDTGEVRTGAPGRPAAIYRVRRGPGG